MRCRTFSLNFQIDSHFYHLLMLLLGRGGMRKGKGTSEMAWHFDQVWICSHCKDHNLCATLTFFLCCYLGFFLLVRKSHLNSQTHQIPSIIFIAANLDARREKEKKLCGKRMALADLKMRCTTKSVYGAIITHQTMKNIAGEKKTFMGDKCARGRDTPRKS